MHIIGHIIMVTWMVFMVLSLPTEIFFDTQVIDGILSRLVL